MYVLYTLAFECTEFLVPSLPTFPVCIKTLQIISVEWSAYDGHIYSRVTTICAGIVVCVSSSVLVDFGYQVCT